MKKRKHIKKLMATVLALFLFVVVSQPLLANTDDAPPAPSTFPGEPAQLGPEGATTDSTAPGDDMPPENAAQEDGADAPENESGGTDVPEDAADGTDAPQDAEETLPGADAIPVAADEYPQEAEGAMVLAAALMINMGSRMEGVDFEQVYLDAEQTQVDESSVIVLTNAGLVEALTNTYPFRNIYLGADIISGNDLTINASKAGVRLVGQRPEGGATHTYTQLNSSAIFRINTLTGGASFTFESINLQGLNYWGIAYGGGAANHVVFKNVTYEGPQMLHSTGSTVTLQDCDIHVVNRPLNGNASSQAQELFEIGGRCEVLGTVSIRSESTVEEVFDLASGANFTVRAGTSLNVTARDQLFTAGLNMVLETGAAVNASTTSYPFNGSMSSFTMGSGASFDLTCNSGTNHLLPVNGTLNVNDAARLSLNLASGSDGNGIYYTGSTPATLDAGTIYVKSSGAGIYSTRAIAVSAAGSITVNTGTGHAIHTTAALTLQNSGTVALRTGGTGAGIHNTGGGVTIANCGAIDITTQGSGAGINTTAASTIAVSNCDSLSITATGSGAGIVPTGNAAFTDVGLDVNTNTGVGFLSTTTGAQLTFTGGSAAFNTGASCFSISGSGSTLAFDNLPVSLSSGDSCIDHNAVGGAIVRFTQCPTVLLTAAVDGVRMRALGAASLDFYRPGRLEITAGGICVNAVSGAKSISFTNPGRAILLAGGAGVVGVNGTSAAYATKVSITTGALNRWNSPSLGAAPDNIWNLADGGAMVISGSSMSSAGVFTIGAAQSTLPDVGIDPVTEALTTQTLKLTGTPLVVLGELDLTIDTVYDLSPAIAGQTAAGAAVSAAFVDGAAAMVSGSAGGDGAYSLDILAYEPDVGTTVTVTSRHEELSVRKQTVVQDSSPFTLSIEAPQAITYGTVAISPEEQWVSLADDLRITVTDSRLRRSSWTLYVQVNGAFTAVVDATSHALAGYMVLEQPAGEPVTLGSAPQPVYTRSNNFDDVVIIDFSEALRLYLPPWDGVGYAVFTVDIHWYLVVEG